MTKGNGMSDTEVLAPADDGVTLAGTLTLPDRAGPHPAVLLLHGSGRTDRDGNIGRLRLELGAPLAAALAAAGIAVLRYDRRGVGASGGDWLTTGLERNRADAEAALRALAARPEIRSGSIGVVGHSEGALHAMALGARREVAAVVLLAGFAGPGEEALRRQARALGSDLPAPLRPVLPLLGWYAERQVRAVKASRDDVLRLAGSRRNARWLREVFQHDSRADLAAITAPVLAITGDKDVQVDPDDLDVIRGLVPGPVETRRPADLTHLLRRDPGRPSIRSYPRQLRQPVDRDLIAHLTGWLAHHLSATTDRR